MLTSEELERYARHIVLREVGGPGQAALRRARVLVVGAGGLGAPVLLYLGGRRRRHARHRRRRHGVAVEPAAPGDPRHADIGRPKVESAAATDRDGSIRMCAIEPHAVRLDAANALDLIGRYDIVADGSDNFATRYLASDACYLARRAAGHRGGRRRSTARITTIRAHETGPDGRANPTYRCLFPEPPPPGTVPACAEAGILGALPGIVGSLMALEVIREIVGFGEGLARRLLMIDARAMRFETLRYAWDPDNPLVGRTPNDP